jgi:hypothetical protein
LFDLLHAVLPTKLPREEFYKQFARAADETKSSVHRAMRTMLLRRPDLIRAILPNVFWFYARTWRYQRVHRDYRSFVRDEAGLLNGPGIRKALTWRDIEYPDGEEATAKKTRAANGKLVKLRVPTRTWVDDAKDAAARVQGSPADDGAAASSAIGGAA